MNDLEQTVRRLAERQRIIEDRQEILDCLTRYCRAMDRCDMDLLLTVYHDGAIDDHSSVVADAKVFGQWAFDFHLENQNSTQHCITNHSCDLQGDVAHTETYFMLAAMNKRGAALALRGGRYIDRFERRNGRWAIAVRRVVTDWFGTPGEMELPAAVKRAFNAAGKPARDRSDLSYDRPLEILPERLEVMKRGLA